MISCVQLFVTPWTAACQGIPVLHHDTYEFAQTHMSLLRLISIELMMHLLVTFINPLETDVFITTLDSLLLSGCNEVDLLSLVALVQWWNSRYFLKLNIVGLLHCASFRCIAKWFVIHVYVYIIFFLKILFHYSSLQDIKYSSLCYTVNPCFFNIYGN